MIVIHRPERNVCCRGSLEVVNAAGVTAGFQTDAADTDAAFFGTAPNGRKYVKFFIGNGATGYKPVVSCRNRWRLNPEVQSKSRRHPGTIINTTRLVVNSQAGDNFTDDGTAVIGEAGGPVPVKLLLFTANKTGNNTLVKWTTEIEINSDYFEVQQRRRIEFHQSRQSVRTTKFNRA